MPNSLGKLDYNEEKEIITVTINDNISSSKLKDMWNDFLSSGAVPSHVKKFILNNKTFHPDKGALDLIKLEEYWYKTFPNKKLAIVINDPLGVAVAIMMSKKHLIKPFSTLEGAEKWLDEWHPK